MVSILEARDAEMVQAVATLFREYAAGLGISLEFQDFAAELARLPGEYGPPGGRLLLARDGETEVGCVALRKLDDGICEMKRLYVRPPYRRGGTGRRLAERAIEEARRIGYRKMRLDTLPAMQEAQALYLVLGFREIAAYRFNPVPGTRYLELGLERRGTK